MIFPRFRVNKSLDIAQDRQGVCLLPFLREHWQHRRPTKKLRGFSLLEMVAVMTIVALVALIVAPRYNATSGPQALKSTAFEIASLLRQSRVAAIRSGTTQAFSINVRDRRAWAAKSETSLAIPEEFTLRHDASSRCDRRGGTNLVVFQPNGKSCGSIITLRLGDVSAAISTNWLTGATKVVFEGATGVGAGA